MRSWFATLVVLVLAAALSAQAPVTWRIRDAPPELRTVVSRADLMIAAMHDSVLRELADGFAQGGADLAINSCDIDSLLITQVGAEYSLETGVVEFLEGVTEIG